DTTGHADALRVLRQARSDQEVLAAAPGSTASDRLDLANTIQAIGRLLLETSRAPEAEVEYRKVLAIRRKMADDHPAVAEFRILLAHGHNTLGYLLMQTSRLPEAEAEHRKALAIRQKLADDHPAVAELRSSVAISLQNLGLL